MSARRTSAALAVAFTLAACSGGEDAPPDETIGTTAPPATTTTVAPTTTTVPGPPPVPASADEAASRLARAERTIADPATAPSDVADVGHEQQVLYRALVANPDWRAVARAAMPDALRPAFEANLAAGADLRAMITPRESLPPWRIVAPAPAEELLRHYKEAGAEIGVPWPYLASIHLVETRMGRIRGTSTAGAQGPMQFMPATWGQYGAGGDINDNRDAIFGAARLLRNNGAPDDMANALFNYNRSTRYVRAVTAYAEQIAADERRYHAYWGWEVYYVTVNGDVLLPIGYGA